MEEIPFDLNEKRSLLQKVISHFRNGRRGTYPSFPFDIWLSGIDDAISEAKKQSKVLIVYIFCSENYNTDFVNTVLCTNSIAAWINKHAIFYANEITSADGWRIAAELRFEKMPILAIVQPNGATLKRCNFYMKHEGVIGEGPILSYFLLIHPNNDSDLIMQQDEEYLKAVQEAEENNGVSALECSVHSDEKAKVEEEFEQLPNADGQSGAVNIRFNFPDNTTKMRKFPKDGKANLLFIYIRKFLFPQKFNLLSGFPLKKICDDNTLISSISPLNNFVVIVDITDT